MKRLVVGVTVAACLALPGMAIANESSCAPWPPPKPSPRISRFKVDGLYVNVLLPAGYRASVPRRYPVLYLLHAFEYDENVWLTLSDVERFTANFTGRKATVIVMPDGGPGGWYTDWRDGTELWETYELRRVIPAVEARFRVLRDRGHRAVAGFSMGAYGALDLAARHPDLFAAVGGFSPEAHITIPEDPYTGAPPSNPRAGAGSPGPQNGGRPRRRYHPPDDAGSGCGGGGSGSPQWGDRTTDAVNWHGHNPTDLVSNLRGARIYVANGNGIPCGPEDLIDRPTFVAPGEAGLLAMSKDFAAAARAASVPVTTDFYGCGLHTMRYAERDLHRFWPLMTQAFGRRPPPARFSYRATDPDFVVWGWTFHADRKRADEFLEVRQAGRRGVTLTGSGTETVVTKCLFRRGQTVHVSGAKPALARADRCGRLHLAVDLGSPNVQRQFTPGAHGTHFITRAVRFKP